CQQYSGLPWTF
nr:immunoglobulin light chain junction region [Macaca mulatta]